MSSITYSESTSFTLTHAKYLSSKVATDLKRIQRFYPRPTDAEIANYESELTALLKGGYMKTVVYGYQRDGQWIEPTLRYTDKDILGGTGIDNDPGKIMPNANIAGASFTSFLIYSQAWWDLTEAQRHAFKSEQPFYRGNGNEPTVNGLMIEDKTYSSGGRALNRASVRSY